MSWRVFTTLSFVAIVGGGCMFLVAAGWIPWAVPVAGFVLGGVVVGFMVRRRRGTQVTSATPPLDLPSE